MGYILLWLAGLACSLLFVALIVSLASRCKKQLWRRLWPSLVAIVMFFAFGFVAFIGGLLLHENLQPKWFMWYGLSQVIAYLIGAFIILKKGYKGIASHEQAARSWPRAVLAVALGLVLFIYVVTLNFMDVRMLSELEHVRAETTGRINDLMPPRLPDALNAYAVYKQASRTLDTREASKWLQESDSPDFDPVSEGITRFLVRHRDTLSLARKAASMPGYSMERMVANFYESPIPQFIPNRNLARLLNLSARSKALNSDFSGALKELVVMKDMAEHLRSYPVLVSFLIAKAVNEIRVQGLEYVLAHTTDPSADLIDLPVITQSLVRDSFIKTLQSEGNGMLQTLAIMATDKDFNTKLVPSLMYRYFTTFWRIFFLPSDVKAVKEIIAYRMGKGAKTYAEALANLKAICQARASGEFGMLTGNFTVDYSPYLVRAMQYDAERGLSDAALAATAYKCATGTYPAALEELVQRYLTAIPVDPFDGKPLKIKVLDGGLDLYSVGPGKELDSYSNTKGPIHFYLGRAPYEEHRVKPAIEARKKHKRSEKNRGRAKK